MAFKDYETFATGLELPLYGKTYSIPEIGAKTGARLHLLLRQADERRRIAEENVRAAEAAKQDGEEPPEPKPLPDVPEDPTNEELLGDVLQEMYDDDVPDTAIRKAAFTVYYDMMLGREAAEVYWNSGGDPKALESFIDQQVSLLMNGAGANMTKKRASTSGTKSKTKSSRNTTAESKPSTTETSSSTGDS